MCDIANMETNSIPLSDGRFCRNTSLQAVCDSPIARILYDDSIIRLRKQILFVENDKFEGRIQAYGVSPCRDRVVDPIRMIEHSTQHYPI